MLMPSFLSILTNGESHITYKYRSCLEKEFYEDAAIFAFAAKIMNTCIHEWVKRGKKRLKGGLKPSSFTRRTRQLNVRQMNKYTTLANEALIKMQMNMRLAIRLMSRTWC